VMKARMQPVSNVFSKMPRLVRDLTHALGRRARLQMEGQETELDKSLLEAIKDPLTHAVRNSLDHGIETPAEREAAGKDPEGTLILRAVQEGSHVVVEVSDDGAGIAPEKIRNKAIERGLLTPERAAQLGERDLLQLIFLPGFSTATAVTNVSGRGVGMDVVSTNVEKIGGKVEIDSRVGKGTTLKLSIQMLPSPSPDEADGSDPASPAASNEAIDGDGFDRETDADLPGAEANRQPARRPRIGRPSGRTRVTSSSAP